jgi:hypothetical protein
MKIRRFSWYLLFAVFVLSAAMAHAEVIYLSPSDYPSSLGIFSPTGTQLGRLNRNGVPSDWSASKSFPGVFNPATIYNYQVFDVNVGLYPFIQIEFDDPYAAFFASAYLGSYAPANLALNYLGDPGSSGNPFGNPNYFQVQVPINTELLIVINETTHNGGIGLPFGLMVEGFYDTNFTDATNVPEPSTILLVCAGMALLPLLLLRGSRT